MGFQFKVDQSSNISNRSTASLSRWQRIGNPRSIPRSNSEDGSGHTISSVEDDAVEDVDWETELEPSRSFKLYKKRLYPEEIQKFKRMGKPDLEQNFLELFSAELVDDMFSIMDYGSDNYEKADYMLKELGPYGFYEIGEGTNILVVGNDRYPGVVFKIALDHNGIADNFNDELLQRVVPHYTRVFARHSTGIVSVQEYSVTMTKERMTQFYPRIIKLLEKLSKTYLIADLSPSRFLNFGINRQGDYVIQDGSDLYPLSQLTRKFRCKNPCGWDPKKREMLLCGGKLEYSADFLVLRCKKCGHEINPLELRPNEKEEKALMANIMHDGLSSDERDQMEAEELKWMTKNFQSGDTEVIVQEEEQPAEEDVTDVEEEVNPVEVKDTAEPKEEEDESEGSEISMEHNGDIFEHQQTEQSDDSQDEPYQPAEDDEEEPDDGPKMEVVHDIDHASMYDTQYVTQSIPSKDNPEFVKSLADKLKQLAGSQPQEPEQDGKTPPIQFTIIDDEHPDPSNSPNGLYMNIHGDFAKAWDEAGIPIFISLDNGETYDIAISSNTLEILLTKVVDMIKNLSDD